MQVPVRVEKAEEIGSLNFILAYDPTVVQVDKVDKGDLVRRALFRANTQESGIIRFGLAATDAISGSGPVAHIIFRAVGNEGSRCALTLSEVLPADASGRDLTMGTQDGAVTIERRSRGDFDGDRELKLPDAMAALKMSVKEFEEDLGLDMDENGRVTAEDARVILKAVVSAGTQVARPPRTTPTSSPTPSLTKTQSLGEETETISASSGGTVSLPSGVAIHIPPAALDRDSPVTVRARGDLSLARDANMRLPPRGYEFSVEGQEIFETPVNLVIPYQEDEIPPDVSEDDLRVAYYDEGAEEWIPQDAKIDSAANTISIPTNRLSMWTWFTDKYDKQHLTTDNFDIEFVVEGPDAVQGGDYVSYIQTVGEALESAKQKLDAMGFRTRGRVQYTDLDGLTQWHLVRVVVRNLNEPGDEPRYGQAFPSKLGDDFSWLEVDNDASRNALKATVAHEYFHLCQDLYFTNLWYVRSPYLWIHEGTALWFEDLLYPENNGYVEQLDANADFIRASLDTNTIPHGYGTGAFFKYLAARYGNGIIRDIYDAIATQSIGGRNAVGAIDKAVARRGGPSSGSLHYAFNNFSARYFTKRDFDEAAQWQLPTVSRRAFSSERTTDNLKAALAPLSAQAYSFTVDRRSPVTGAVSLNANFSGPAASDPIVLVYAGERQGSEIIDWPYIGALSPEKPALAVPNVGEPLGDDADKNMVMLVAINRGAGDGEVDIAAGISSGTLVARAKITDISAYGPYAQADDNWLEFAIDVGSASFKLTGLLALSSSDIEMGKVIIDGGEVSQYDLNLDIAGQYTGGLEERRAL